MSGAENHLPFPKVIRQGEVFQRLQYPEYKMLTTDVGKGAYFGAMPIIQGENGIEYLASTAASTHPVIDPRRVVEYWDVEKVAQASRVPERFGFSTLPAVITASVEEVIANYRQRLAEQPSREVTGEDIRIGEQARAKYQEELEQDDLEHSSFVAIRVALAHARNAVIVNMGEVRVNQESLAQRIAMNNRRFRAFSVEDILTKRPLVPNDTEGLIVTGYSRRFYSQPDQEETIEVFVRGTANNLSAVRPQGAELPTIIVLSETLPDENIFNNAHAPWFNGPFQSGSAVWELKPKGKGVELVGYESEYNDPLNLRNRSSSWKETKRFIFAGS